jgi:DNA-binding SARP family transcriptional activator
MRSLCASGATVDALGAYAELRQQTVNELGSEPGPASQQLYLEMLRADAHPSGAASTANEIRLLLKMLGDLLQGCPGVELAHEQRRVLRDAQRLVEAA